MNSNSTTKTDLERKAFERILLNVSGYQGRRVNLPLTRRERLQNECRALIDSQEHLLFETVTCKPNVNDTTANQMINTYIDNLNWFLFGRKYRRDNKAVEGICVKERQGLKNNEALHFHALLFQIERPWIKSREYFDRQAYKARDFTNREFGRMVIDDVDVRGCYGEKFDPEQPWEEESLSVYLTKNFDNKYYTVQQCLDSIGLLNGGTVEFGGDELPRIET